MSSGVQASDENSVDKKGGRRGPSRGERVRIEEQGEG